MIRWLGESIGESSRQIDAAKVRLAIKPIFPLSLQFAQKGLFAVLWFFSLLHWFIHFTWMVDIYKTPLSETYLLGARFHFILVIRYGIVGVNQLLILKKNMSILCIQVAE